MLQLFLLKYHMVSFQSKPFLTQPAIRVTLSAGCNKILLILLCILNGAWANSSLCFPHVCTCLDLKEGICTHPPYFCRRHHTTSNVPVNVPISEFHIHVHCGGLPLLPFHKYLWVLVKEYGLGPEEENFSSLICCGQLLPHLWNMYSMGNHTGEGLFALKLTALDTKHTNIQKSVHMFQHRD